MARYADELSVRGGIPCGVCLGTGYINVGIECDRCHGSGIRPRKYRRRRQ